MLEYVTSVQDAQLDTGAFLPAADYFTDTVYDRSYCLWLRTSHTETLTGFFSWANEDNHNAILLYDPTNVRFFAGDLEVVSDINLADDQWHHFCFKSHYHIIRMQTGGQKHKKCG